MRNEATELRLRKDLAREELPELAETRFDRWAEAESFELAKPVVYRGGKVTGNPVRDAAPVLPAGYTDEAKAVGQRQIVLAGYRLAFDEGRCRSSGKLTPPQVTRCRSC